ncbi:MAG: DNA-binding protein WhiA [Bacilli bacterium]|jgi:DNA-binding protein WhiA
MSFSIKIKKEITNLEKTKAEKIAELSAFIRNNAYIDENLINIHTENITLAKWVFKLLKDLYDINPQIIIRRNFNFKKNYSYFLSINPRRNDLLKDLSIINKEGFFINIPREYIIGDEELIKAYLRGVFLASGSINNPKTSQYHLEIAIDELEYALFMESLLNSFNLNSKMIKRIKGYVIYIKAADKISDFLKMIEAHKGVLYFEDVRVYKEQRNITNRLNNCEQANVERIINTAFKQIEDINLIKEELGLHFLDNKLEEVAKYRLKYPEYSLLELSDIITSETKKPISKSGLYHRFRKIKQLADNIRKNKIKSEDKKEDIF